MNLSIHFIKGVSAAVEFGQSCQWVKLKFVGEALIGMGGNETSYEVTIFPAYGVSAADLAIQIVESIEASTGTVKGEPKP